jgi:hypothetical protein
MPQFSYHVHNQLNLIVMLLSLYRVSAEGKFHLFTCINNGIKEMQGKARQGKAIFNISVNNMSEKFSSQWTKVK